MKRLIVVFVVCLVFVACSEEIQPLKSLQKGMPNTTISSTGDVVYDLNGEWDAILGSGPTGTSKNIFKITQEGNKFVGISSIETRFSDKGSEVIKGELEKNGFKSVEINTLYFAWIPSIGKIDESCNKIVVKAILGDKAMSSGFNTLTATLTRK